MVLLCLIFLIQVVCGKQSQTPNSKGGSYQDNTGGGGSHDGEISSHVAGNCVDDEENET